MQAATAQRQSGPAFTGRTAVLAGLIVLIVIFVIVQIVGAAQEKAQRKKDLEYYSWENVQRRANGGQ